MNRVCQYFELITAAGGADGLSSSGMMVRPGARPDAEHVVEVAGGDEGGRDLRLAVDDDVHPAIRRAGEQVAHRAVVGDELLIHRVRERRCARLPVRIAVEKP